MKKWRGKGEFYTDTSSFSSFKKIIYITLKYTLCTIFLFILWSKKYSCKTVPSVRKIFILRFILCRRKIWCIGNRAQLEGRETALAEYFSGQVKGGGEAEARITKKG